MAYAVALAAAGGAWAMTAHALDLRKRQQEQPPEEKLAPPPFQGLYTHQRQYVNCDDRGRFVSVKEDFDVNGARIFIVDKGTGSRTIYYTDPRVQY